MKPIVDSEPRASGKTNETVRYFIGYLTGLIVFMVLIPSILWCIASIEDKFIIFPIIPFDYLRIGVSGILFISGMVFVIWSNIFLFFTGKGGPTDFAGVTVTPRTQKLVISGPYKYTRNPMVFGANAVYLSISLYFNSWLCLLALILFIIIFVRIAIEKEEERLLNDFGIDFENYRKTTSMIIPLPRKKVNQSS
jgi:protein-S-isoprenylcysteine O-methyltransferase Ste14